ncbi:hypothetical protein Tco_0319457 [Tanacetum coccineum]
MPPLAVYRLILKWDEKIKLHLGNGDKVQSMLAKISRLASQLLLNAPVKVEGGMDDEGEVTLYLMRRSLKVLRKFHWMILGGRFNQLSHVSSLFLSKPGEY